MGFQWGEVIKWGFPVFSLPPPFSRISPPNLWEIIKSTLISSGRDNIPQDFPDRTAISLICEGRKEKK